MTGPLKGVKIVEFGGIGPPPMCGMLLADMGADILRIDRTQPSGLGLPVPPRYSVMDRSRRSVAVDLKKPEGIEAVMRLLEPLKLRAGVMERLAWDRRQCGPAIHGWCSAASRVGGKPVP